MLVHIERRTSVQVCLREVHHDSLDENLCFMTKKKSGIHVMLLLGHQKPKLLHEIWKIL